MTDPEALSAVEPVCEGIGVDISYYEMLCLLGEYHAKACNRVAGTACKVSHFSLLMHVPYTNPNPMVHANITTRDNNEPIDLMSITFASLLTKKRINKQNINKY